MKHYRFIIILIIVTAATAIGTATEGSIPELWQKALKLFSANKDWIPGTIIQRTELLTDQGKPESTHEIWIEYKKDDKDKITSEIVKVIKDGKDVTDEFKKEQNKKQKKKDKEDSASFELNDNPFNPDLQKNVSIKATNETQRISGKNCACFEFSQKVEFRENDKILTVTNRGKAWLDKETGYPLKLEYTFDPLPKRMKSIWTIILYEITPEGNWYAKEMTMDGEAGFLFIKKKFHTLITFNNFWKHKS